MIQSFRCKDTHDIFLTRRSHRWSTAQSVARRKLDQLEAATRLEDIRVPPGNRLEPLQGARKGQHSIRIPDQFQDQWRICFTWQQDGAHDVEIVDYHG